MTSHYVENQVQSIRTEIKRARFTTKVWQEIQTRKMITRHTANCVLLSTPAQADALGHSSARVTGILSFKATQHFKKKLLI